VSADTTLPADTGTQPHEGSHWEPRAPARPPREWPRHLRRELGYKPFLITLGVAFALRVLTMIIYFPAYMDLVDSVRFARAVPGQTGLFSDFWMPAGYPLFLKIVHHLSSEVWVTIAIQHLLGLFTGAVIFLMVRRCGAPRWLATVAAAVALFSGDLLFLEHVFMADQFLFMFTVLACGATIMGLIPRVNRRWLAAAGALAMVALLSRSVALAVIFTLLVVTLFAAVGGWRGRLLSGGALLAGAGVVLLMYVVAFEAVGGTYLGIDDMGGWNLYARVAPFADCRDFTPPAGTRVLCQTTPASQRLGPFEYEWDSTSVSLRHFVLNPSTAGKLQTFAIRAIEGQPTAYAQAVLTDLGRYIEPSIGTQRGFNGQPRELVSFGFRSPPVEAEVEGGLAPRYNGTKVSAPGVHFMAVYQTLFRPDRLVLLAALLLTLAGLVFTRGAARIATAVFGLTALGLVVLPTLTLSYDFRYGIPSAILLTISGMLALWGMIVRWRAREVTPA
jgi:hypothetical protein